MRPSFINFSNPIKNTSRNLIQNLTKLNNYKDNAKQKTMALSGVQFLKRFCLHIVPNRFRKIRHYGFLSNAVKKKGLNFAKTALLNKLHNPLTKAETKAYASMRMFGNGPRRCPSCKKGELIVVGIILSNKDPPVCLIP